MKDPQSFIEEMTDKPTNVKKFSLILQIDAPYDPLTKANTIFKLLDREPEELEEKTIQKIADKISTRLAPKAEPYVITVKGEMTPNYVFISTTEMVVKDYWSIAIKRQKGRQTHEHEATDDRGGR